MKDRIMYTNVKYKLNQAFKEIRKEGILARQNFSCCQGCGSYDLVEAAEQQEKNGKKKVLGYVFYHRQDNEKFLETGKVHLAFTSLHKDLSTKQLGLMIVAILLKNGICLNWDYTSNTRIEVTGTTSIEPTPIHHISPNDRG